MGKNKSNPLKYFNDQAESRSKNMGKALKRFQDENSVKTPDMPPPPTSKPKPNLAFDLSMPLPGGNPNAKSASNIRAGYRTEEGQSPSEGTITGGYDYTSKKGRTSGVQGSYNPSTGEYDVGASYSGRIGKTGPTLNVGVTYGSQGFGGSGNMDMSRPAPGRKPLANDRGNQSAQTAPKSIERKGGSIRKKKK